MSKAQDELRAAMDDELTENARPQIPTASSTYAIKTPSIPRRELPKQVIEKVVEVIPPNAMIVEDGVIRMGRYTLTGVGLIIDEGIDEGEWLAVGDVLRKLDRSIQWLIGDWVVQGGVVYRKTYEELAEITGYEIRTLHNFASICSRVEISRRRENLSFGHHDAVAAKDPDEQVYWLDLAEEKGWSVSALRKAMNPPLPSPALLAPERVRKASQRVLSWRAEEIETPRQEMLDDIDAAMEWLEELRADVARKLGVR